MLFFFVAGLRMLKEYPELHMDENCLNSWFGLWSYVLRGRCLLVVCCLIPLSAFGEDADGLVWDRLEVDLKVELGADEVVAEFGFKNDGKEPVRIVSTTPSCGCTVTSLEKTDFAPRESGVVQVVFSIGSRQGKQNKTITVVVDSSSGGTRVYELRLIVEVPAPLMVIPRVCFWNLGERPDAKVVRLTFHQDLPVELSGVSLKDGELREVLDFNIETVVESREYNVRLMPLSTETKARYTLIMEAAGEGHDELLSRYPIYVIIK